MKLVDNPTHLPQFPIIIKLSAGMTAAFGLETIRLKNSVSAIL
jgi:hypothetical protein